LSRLSFTVKLIKILIIFQNPGPKKLQMGSDNDSTFNITYRLNLVNHKRIVGNLSMSASRVPARQKIFPQKQKKFQVI